LAQARRPFRLGHILVSLFVCPALQSFPGMQSFQKPENALKRSEELIEVGKHQDALDTLNLAIQNRKWSNNWNVTLERIMTKHLELCVELKKMRVAREGLHKYRTTCQAANIGSLELVVQVFRKKAEEKVNEAKAQTEGLRTEKMDNLEEEEPPQAILLKAIQAHDTRQQSQDRDVHSHFRFLWDTYKVILDVLKSNVRLEEVYHETAQHALEFCRQNKRVAEFKKLIDSLRKNWQDFFRRTGTMQNQVNPSNPETISRTIETRFSQLRTATELDLWREAYTTATEINDLMNKAKTKPKQRSEYYEYLGRIFWKSDNHLFHAFACLKNLLFVKVQKRDLSPQELQILASKALMATLCVPFQKNSDIHTTLELTTSSSESLTYDKAKKHAALFNAQSVPTRETIIGSLVEKNLVAYAAEPCQKLFALIESDFTPLSLCQDAKPFLDQIEDEAGNVCEGKLADYITPVKRIIFLRLMKQLSEVYQNMTIENFERAASIVPFAQAEKWMANAARQQGINIQINYREKAIVFGATRKFDMKSLRQPLIEIGYKLQQAMSRVAPEEQHKKEKLERQQLSHNIVRRIDEETRLIRQRKEEIERRKEETERKKEIQQKEEIEKIKKQEMQEAQIENLRQENERKRRAQEREEEKVKQIELNKQKEMLEQLQKTTEKARNAFKVGGKKVTDISVEDLQEIGIAQVQKAREMQVQRERQEKIRQRKLEMKRIDHLARALREQEESNLDEWADEQEAKDRDFLEQAEAEKAEEQRKMHAEALLEKEKLIVFQSQKDQWISEQMSSRDSAYREQMEARNQRCQEKVVRRKIERARARMEKAQQEEQESREREEKRRADEERRRQEEEEREEEERREAERKRIEEERKAEEEEERKRKAEAKAAERRQMDEMRERAEAKRRAREKEIEERMAGGGGDRDRDDRRDDRREERPERRGGFEKREEGNWRDRGDRGDREERNTGAGGSWRDRQSGGGGGGGWGRDREQTRRDDGPPAWRRPARDNDDDGGDFRRGPRRDERRDDDDGGPWRRGEDRRGGGRDDRDDDRRDDRGDRGGWGARRDEEQQPWSRPRRDKVEREEPDSPPSRPPARNRDDDEDEGFSRPKSRTVREEPKEEPPAPAEDEDDGFTTVQAGKKKGKKAGAPAEEERAPPPWKRNKDAAPRGDGDAPRRDATGDRQAPWRKNQGKGGERGADGADRWR